MTNRIAIAAHFNAFADQCVETGLITRAQIANIHEGEASCSLSAGAWILNFVTLEILNVIAEGDARTYLSLRAEARDQNFFGLF